MHEQAACTLDADHEWSVLQVYTAQLGLAWIHMLTHRCSFSILFMLLCVLISCTISTFTATLSWFLSVHTIHTSMNEMFLACALDRAETIHHTEHTSGGTHLYILAQLLLFVRGFIQVHLPWLSVIQSIGNWINSTLLMRSPLRSIPWVWQWDLVWNLVRVVDCEPRQSTVLTELKEAAIITLPASIDQQHRSNCKRIIIMASIHWSTYVQYTVMIYQQCCCSFSTWKATSTNTSSLSIMYADILLGWITTYWFSFQRN